MTELVYALIAVFMLLGVLGIESVIVAASSRSNKFEDSEEFEKTVEHFKMCGKLNEYQKRTKKIILLSYAGFILFDAIWLILLFAPIFEIKTELLGTEISKQSFSLFDEMKLFFSHYQFEESSWITGASLIMLIVIPGIVNSLWFALAYDFGPLSYGGKMRWTIEFSRFGEKAKRQTKFPCRRLSLLLSGELMGVPLFLLCMEVLCGGLYYLVIKNDKLLSAASYMPFLNSASWGWVAVVIILFIGCFAFTISLHSIGKALARELTAECDSAVPESQQK